MNYELRMMKGQCFFSSQAQWRDWGLLMRLADMPGEAGDGKGWFLQLIYVLPVN